MLLQFTQVSRKRFGQRNSPALGLPLDKPKCLKLADCRCNRLAINSVIHEMLVGHRQLAVVVAAVVRQLNRNSVEHAPRGQLRRWVEQRGAGREPTAAARRPTTQATLPSADHAAEIARLQRENERLRMERDILKKSIAIFAGAPK